MNALVKISLLMILPLVICLTTNVGAQRSGPVKWEANGVEVWQHGTKFYIFNTNEEATADIVYMLDGKKQEVELEPQKGKFVYSSETEPEFELLGVSIE